MSSNIPPGFVRVATTSEIPEPGKILVEVDDRLVVVFHVGGKFWAIDDVCTHDGGPLGEGELDGYSIACPRHGAKFDIRDGSALSLPATRPTLAHEVHVEGDDIYVRVNTGESSPSSRAEPAASAQQTVTSSAAGSTPPANEPKTAETMPATHRELSLSEEAVREALKAVVDPELFVNIVDLGLVYDVRISDPQPDESGELKRDVAIEMTLTSPACPAGPQLIQQSKATLARMEGVGQVDVKLVMTPPWAPDRMTDEARDQLGIF